MLGEHLRVERDGVAIVAADQRIVGATPQRRAARGDREESDENAGPCCVSKCNAGGSDERRRKATWTRHEGRAEHVSCRSITARSSASAYHRDENEHGDTIEAWESFDTRSSAYLMFTDGGQQGDGTELSATLIDRCR
jgi:hypothetical protein